LDSSVLLRAPVTESLIHGKESYSSKTSGEFSNNVTELSVLVESVRFLVLQKYLIVHTGTEEEELIGAQLV